MEVLSSSRLLTYLFNHFLRFLCVSLCFFTCEFVLSVICFLLILISTGCLASLAPMFFFRAASDLILLLVTMKSTINCRQEIVQIKIVVCGCSCYSSALKAARNLHKEYT